VRGGTLFLLNFNLTDGRDAHAGSTFRPLSRLSTEVVLSMCASIPYAHRGDE